jgi:TRAP-type C4-dicarboxylate transport system permease small subunit
MSAMALILFVQVVMRYVMQSSLSWSEELARYLFVWLVYLGISYGAKIMKHIKIDAALGLFPAKIRPHIVILGELIFLGFSLFICYSSYGLVRKQIMIGQTSPAMQMPMWILYAAPMVGFGLVAFREAQALARRFSLLRQGG